MRARRRSPIEACFLLALACGCDITGHVPDVIDPTLIAFQAGCSGAEQTYDVYVKVDVTIEPDDEVEIQWYLITNFSTYATFTPSLDCGSWGGGFDVYDGSTTGGGLDLVPDPGQKPDYAFCVRGDGPPRQIVTLRGVAALPAGTSTNETLSAEFDVSSCRWEDGACAASNAFSSKRRDCAD